MIFHSHANKTNFHKKGCALSLILKVRVLELGSGLMFQLFRSYFLVGSQPLCGEIVGGEMTVNCE